MTEATDSAEEHRGPGRPKRSAAKWEVRAERQAPRGGALDMSIELKLEMPAEMYAPGAPLDPAVWASRWITDESNRLHTETRQRGWDFVSTDGTAGLLPVADARADSTLISQPVSVDNYGHPLRGYLCRMPKEHYDALQANVMTHLDDQMQGIRDGSIVPSPAAGSDAAKTGKAGAERVYAPRGQRVIEGAAQRQGQGNGYVP